MRSRVTLGIIGLILSVALTWPDVATHAQQATQVDVRMFAPLRWRELGPMRAGLTTAVGVSPEPGVVYAGVSAAGLWRTNDYGTSWHLIHEAPPRGLVTAIVVAPSSPMTIYAALEHGLVASRDGGRSWSAPAGADLAPIARIAVDPHDPTRIWIAARAADDRTNAGRGLFHSVDGGVTLERLAVGDAGAGAVDVAVTSDSPAAVYAALTRGADVSATSNAGRSGLFRSTDGGATWDPLTRGLPVSLDLRAASLAIAPTRPQRLYAAIAARTGSGLYRSDDRGDSWSLASNDARAFDATQSPRIVVDARSPDAMFMAAGVVWTSTDGGRELAPWNAQPPGARVDILMQVPMAPTVMVAGGPDGTIVSVNGGATWSSAFTQPTADIASLSTDTAFPYRVCGTLAGARNLCVPNGGGRLSPGEIVPLRGPRGTVADPLDPDAIYGGAFERYDRRTGQVLDVGPADAPIGHVVSMAYATDGRTLYAAGASIWRTTNSGQTWTDVGPPAMRTATGPTRPTTTAWTLSALDARILWTATSDGRLHVTRDGAATWRSLDGPAAGTVLAIEASHFDGNSAYVALAPPATSPSPIARLWRTRDAGLTWTPITSGLGATTIFAIREDLQRRGLLLAATDQSVFVSFDDGDTWQRLRLNLPMTPVQDVMIRESSVIVATAGRGIWQLDDISALRQLTGDITRAQAYLFRPAPAWRMRARPGAQDSPPGSPAANDGTAILTYLVGPTTQGRVMLEVIETVTGDVIRRFEGTAGVPSVPVASPPTSDRLDASPGLHEVMWDLRYTRPAPDRRGPAVLPGTYQVRLTTGERTFRQAVVVRMDPRIRSAPGDLAAQLSLARALDAKAAELQRRLASAAGPGDTMMREALATLIDLSQRVQDVDARPSPRLAAAATAAVGRAEALLARR